MNEYQQNLQEETAYLKETLAFIKKELENQAGGLSSKKKKLIASRRDMWENTVHFSSDFDRMIEINQHLTEVNNQTAAYYNNLKRLKKYETVVTAPYFGRYDFIEDGSSDREKIYIGLQSLIDPKTHKIYVYDWRAPISSIYYRYEPGKASFKSPSGMITGEVLLKRQFKIKDSQLKYFFDCSIKINDEILQEILSRNSSPKMRNIVETIQKEQDIIIRDTENDLLIVQGVAGSGKTSIALHRVAFLLYEGLNLNLSSNNVIIVSPNSVFSSYISSVLPELGEDSVEQTTFNDILTSSFEGRFNIETRDRHLEELIQSHSTQTGAVQLKNIEFKGSATFLKILNRLLWYYAHRIIPFEDIFFDGRVLETKQQLKNRFLNNQTGIPMAKQLKRLENVILDKIHPLRRQRLSKIEGIVQQSEGHELEIKQFARLLSMKEAKVFMDKLSRFTQVDFWHIYKLLFSQRGLLLKLAQGLKLPDNIVEIISTTKENLQKEVVCYEDCAPLLYLKLKVDGSNLFPEIRQVVIDEAQDYYPLQYEIFKLLFREAKYTVLGDINQSVEKRSDISLYDTVADILNKQTTVKMFLQRGYRSSYEINKFTQKLLGVNQDAIPFERHDVEPRVSYKETPELVTQAVANDIEDFLKQGFETISIICKTQQEARKFHSELQDTLKKLQSEIKIKLVKPNDGKLEKGISVIPSYVAKGLEFDVVIVVGTDSKSYSTDFDRRLLYIACTRALHRLVLYYTGEKSPFI